MIKHKITVDFFIASFYNTGMDFVFIFRLISYSAFFIFQLVLIFITIKARKITVLAKSEQTLLTGVLILSVFLMISVPLSILYKFTWALYANAIPAIIGSVVAIIFVMKFMTMRTDEAAHIQAVEAEALKLAEINNITDETYLRAKNLLPLGNDFLVLTANAIRKKVTRQEIYDFVLEKMISEAFADGGIVLIVDAEDEELKVKSFKGIFPPPYQLPADVPLQQVRVETSMKYAQFPLEGNIFADAARSAQPLLIKDAANDERIFKNGDEFFLKASSYLFLPFLSNRQVIGLVVLSRSADSPAFTESDVEICSILADYSSTSIHIVDSLDEESEKDTIANEKELATKIQKLLLPEKLPRFAEIETGVYFQAARGICSDYYDIIRTGDDKIFFIMLDVAGKSIQASVIMIMIRTLLLLTTNTDQSLDTILDWVNKGVTKKINIDHFAGLALVQYNPKEHKLYYTGAGNMSISIFRTASQKFERVRQNTDAIGIDINSRYEVAELSIASDDILMLYSDGAIEALDRRGQSFSLHKIYEIVGINAQKSAKDISKDLKKAYDEFSEGVVDHDDRSILIAKIR